MSKGVHAAAQLVGIRVLLISHVGLSMFSA
jgi:hypothetical protein